VPKGKSPAKAQIPVMSTIFFRSPVQPVRIETRVAASTDLKATLGSTSEDWATNKLHLYIFSLKAFVKKTL
jgi:hypothetical protein